MHRGPNMHFSISPNSFAVLASDLVQEVNSANIREHFHIPVTLKGRNREKEIVAMVDSGASTVFIHPRFVQENKIRTHRLAQPIALFNIDGTPNGIGHIEKVSMVEMVIGDHREKAVFTMADIGPEDVIIGIDWLRKHNPEVDWEQGTLRLSRCPEGCHKADKPPTVAATKKPYTQDTPVFGDL